MHQIGNDKFANVTTFKDKVYIHFRTYFDANEEANKNRPADQQLPPKWIPTKKGVAMDADEWWHFRRQVIDVVDADVMEA